MKRRGVKAAARFLRMPLNDRGHAVPRGASRPTAKVKATRITNNWNSVAARPDLVQQAQQEWPRNDGGIVYLKGPDVPLAVCECGRARRETEARRRGLLRFARSVGSVRLGREINCHFRTLSLPPSQPIRSCGMTHRFCESLKIKCHSAQSMHRMQSGDRAHGR